MDCSPPVSPGRIKQSEFQFPGLADEVASERVVRLRLDQAESRPFVNPPRRVQDIVGPERDPAVPRLARETDALVDELAADTKPAPQIPRAAGVALRSRPRARPTPRSRRSPRFVRRSSTVRASCRRSD